MLSGLLDVFADLQDNFVSVKLKVTELWHMPYLKRKAMTISGRA